jgi:hypothetical protein
MPYAAVKHIPMTTKAAPTSKMMYPLFNIFLENYHRILYYSLLFFQTRMLISENNIRIELPNMLEAGKKYYVKSKGMLTDKGLRKILIHITITM